MKILDVIKKALKKQRFKRLANCDLSLSIGPHSNCVADCENRIWIGKNCEILGTLYSVDDGIIRIGDYTEIRGNSLVGSVEKVEIGNYVIISNNVKIYDNNNHPTSPATRKQMCMDGFYGDAWRWTHAEHSPVIIEDNVWIGEGSTILKGVHIGEGSIIGCHSVVTKDVPPYSIAAGNPAKVVKKIEC